MKIAIISDIHLISEKEPFEEIRRNRSHFALAWRSFEKIITAVNKASVDICVFLGDVVDWCSDANIEFALSLADKLKCEYYITPGNHDFEMYEFSEGVVVGPLSAKQKKEEAQAHWRKYGIAFKNHVISDGQFGLILIDSSTSEIGRGDIEWLKKAVELHRRNIIFTHTPFDTPKVRRAILDVDANKDLSKYVQSGSPGIFEDILEGKTEMIFSGHLHFPVELIVANTRMYCLGLSVCAVGREYLGMGKAVILDTENMELRVIEI